MTATGEALKSIEAYYDAVPRAAADVEEFGPLRLFVKRGEGWPYYGRPALGADATTAFGRAEVDRVRVRQRELRIPEAFEWVHDVTPGLKAAVAASGLDVHDHPLMVLQPARPATGSYLQSLAGAGVAVRIVRPDLPDSDLILLGAVAAVGFGTPGTAMGLTGVEALAEHAARTTAAQLAYRRDRLRRGLTVSAVAETAGGPVSTGSHQPVGGVSEIVGVATLPAFRRRGIGAAVVHTLVEDALRRGVQTVFLTAGDDAVARVYERLGFRRIATACIAEVEG